MRIESALQTRFAPGLHVAQKANVYVLITGATGFVGTALRKHLEALGVSFRTAGRSNAPGDRSAHFRIDDLTRDDAWAAALQGIDAVVHLAARTHVLDDASANPLAEYRRVNVLATAALARAAAAAGVRRLVFLSSIKVNGESTPGAPFAESAAPAPEDAYGVSKWEAETALSRISLETGLESVILRPPLVYGAGVKGNLLRLLNTIARGLPLPLDAIHNQRSLLSVDNLVDAIVCCLNAPTAAGQTYLVSDGTDVSTPALIRTLAAGMDKPARLFPCPVTLLNWAAAALGQRDAVLRLTGSLRVDSSRIRRDLNWQPRLSTEAGLKLTAQWYDRERQRARSR